MSTFIYLLLCCCFRQYQRIIILHRYYVTKWSLCVDVSLNNHSLIHSFSNLTKSARARHCLKLQGLHCTFHYSTLMWHCCNVIILLYQVKEGPSRYCTQYLKTEILHRACCYGTETFSHKNWMKVHEWIFFPKSNFVSSYLYIFYKLNPINHSGKEWWKGIRSQDALPWFQEDD